MSIGVAELREAKRKKPVVYLGDEEKHLGSQYKLQGLKTSEDNSIFQMKGSLELLLKTLNGCTIKTNNQYYRVVFNIYKNNNSNVSMMNEDIN